MTVANQLIAIVNWFASVNTGGVALAVGNVDNAQLMPWYNVRGLSCAQAILECLKFFPAWSRGSTTRAARRLSTCRQRVSLAAVTLPFGCSFDAGNNIVASTNPAAVRHHVKSSPIKPLFALRTPGVVVQYQTTENSTVFISNVVYPPGTTGNEPGAIVVPIDLRGGSSKDYTGKVVAAVFNPTNLLWWIGDPANGIRGKVPHLNFNDPDNNVDLTSFVMKAGQPLVTVTDKFGNAVNLATFPNEYKSGSIYSWMKNGSTAVNLITEVKVTAHLTYDKLDANENILRTVTDQKHSVTVHLTNSPVGTSVYSALQFLDSGQVAVGGLEQTIYNDRSVLQYDSTHEFIEAGSPPLIGPFNLFNLGNGKAAWATMNADIASVVMEFQQNPNVPGAAGRTRRTTVTTGPAKFLTPQDLNGFLQLFRGAIVIDNPQSRLTGNDGGSSIDIEGDGPMQDTTIASPAMSTLNISAPDSVDPTKTNTIGKDATTGSLFFQQLKTADGTVLADGIIPPLYLGPPAGGAPGPTTLK